MKKYIVSSLIILTCIMHAQPGCRQIGNRLESPGDSKNFVYVNCSCPCNEYEQRARRQQCAECKHYHMAEQNTLEILTDIDIDKAHQHYLEDLGY